MTNIKILAFAGSLRKDSYNKKLLRIAVEMIKDAADVTVWDLKEYPLPLYDGDIEVSEGVPENGLKMMDLIEASDGLLIVSPEYNTSIPGVLKNVIDWTSRPTAAKKELQCYRDKVVVLMGASTGYYGAARGIIDLRKVLSSMNAIVLPTQVTIPNAVTAFDESGNLVEQRHVRAVNRAVEKLINVITKLRS